VKGSEYHLFYDIIINEEGIAGLVIELQDVDINQ